MLVKSRLRDCGVPALSTVFDILESEYGGFSTIMNRIIEAHTKLGKVQSVVGAPPGTNIQEIQYLCNQHLKLLHSMETFCDAQNSTSGIITDTSYVKTLMEIIPDDSIAIASTTDETVVSDRKMSVKQYDFVKRTIMDIEIQATAVLKWRSSISKSFDIPSTASSPSCYQSMEEFPSLNLFENSSTTNHPQDRLPFWKTSPPPKKLRFPACQKPV